MRDPGSVTGKRNRDNQSPEEEREREVTRAIKQEMIEESAPSQVNKGERKHNEIIGLTNTDEEMDSNKEQEEDLEKEDNSEESSDNLYGNENSDNSAVSEETSSKEDMTHKERKEVQEEDKSSSKESHSEDEVEIISVSNPTKKSRTVIKESSTKDIEEDSDERYEMPDFNMEHLVGMMAKFHNVQVYQGLTKNKLVKG